MYLDSIQIENFRKFGELDNTICFLGGSSQIDIAKSSTLIIGKNNSGKTTIARALDFTLKSCQPTSSDFNIFFLKKLVEEYKVSDNFDNVSLPELTFTLVIRYDEHENGDLLSNIAGFVSILNNTEDDNKVTITIKYSLQEVQAFKETIKNLKTSLIEDNNSLTILDLSNVLDSSDINFNISYINSADQIVNNFKIKKLIKLKEIKANRRLDDDILSNVFSKIVSYQFTDNAESKERLGSDIRGINETITQTVKDKNESIAQILHQVEDSNHVGLNLSGNVDEKNILSYLIKYQFVNGDDDFIPENQFGLGYINLLNIIGEIVHYVDSYERGSNKNCINLLFIEEPEAFMHPQMQEFFITRIQNAVERAVSVANPSSESPELNCQIIITTHSSHIVNSKITASGSFNNINYLTSTKTDTDVITLTDEKVKGDEHDKNSLKFIIKHIKYKVSELFFADAVIFVEGVTEETLLKYYLDKNIDLNKYYISIFNILGAHAKEYYALIKTLKVPCLVITDLDIKREACEKGQKHKQGDICPICNQDDLKSYKQIEDLTNRTTTNSTLSKFNEDNINLQSIAANDSYLGDGNLKLVYQKMPIAGYFATSLEEAFILTNYNNDMINNTLKHCKPNIYKDILKRNCGDEDNGEQENRDNLKLYSFELQCKLSDAKTDFASDLLYQCILESDVDKIPNLPEYIIDGFNWLTSTLRGDDNNE